MTNQPNFIYIGYQKAGSSFLRSYFSFHPEIAWRRDAILFMTKGFQKQTYLELPSFDAKTRCRIDMYEALAIGYLQDRPDSWGEDDLKPNSYTFGSRLPDRHLVPLRIKESLPHAKIIVTIRNQVDWLRSNYLHFLSKLPDNQRSFDSFVATPEGKRILHSGMFNYTIESYMEVFGKANVHVILLEQLRDELEATLRHLCDFMGVKFFHFPKEKHERNKGKAPWQGNVLRAASSMKIPLGALRRISLAFKPWQSLFVKVFSKDILSTRLKSILGSHYAVSNWHTSRLIDIELDRYGYPL